MYVQTKGRARSKEASFMIISSDLEKQKTSTQILQYRKAHADIGEYLKDRVLERADPQLNDINEHFQDDIPPFINGSGAVLLASSALALVHRYCQHMPSDAFGIVLPWFKLLEQEERKAFTKDWAQKYVVSLTLPLNSALRETIYVSDHNYGFLRSSIIMIYCPIHLQSDAMPYTRLAKISAAFKTCVKLYQMGELNERFLPTTAIERVAEIANIHFEHWKNYGDNGVY